MMNTKDQLSYIVSGVFILYLVLLLVLYEEKSVANSALPIFFWAGVLCAFAFIVAIEYYFRRKATMKKPAINRIEQMFTTATTNFGQAIR